MNKITKDMTIEEVLEKFPDTIKVFIEKRIPCFVCGEPLWGTVEETAKKYGVDLDALLNSLNTEKTTNRKEASLIEMPEGLEIEEIPIEKRYISVIAGLVRRIKILYDTIYERFGKEGLILIRDVSEKYGLEIAERAKKTVKKNDVKSVALYLIKIFNTINAKGKVIKFTDEEVIIRAYECPYPWEKSEICKAHTIMEKTIVETLGKDLRYRTGKSIASGNSYCEHIIKRVVLQEK